MRTAKGRLGTGRMRTGISGLDEALDGGLPRGRTTLVVGGTGSGKTIFALQALAQGVASGEAGVFVTFEESPEDIRANMASFDWAPAGRAAARLATLDGREVRTAFRNGTFDLVGLLAAVEHRSRSTKARRIAFDGLDVLLDLIEDPVVMRREVYRLHDWLSVHGLSAIITAKHQPDDAPLPSRYAFIPFLTECVVVLQHRVVGNLATRSLRIVKCRGVPHSSNDLPMILSSSGLEVVPPRTSWTLRPVFTERVSSGVLRLDTMLDGGYLRGTRTLVSGAPGTGKTSLAGAFAEAACARGEPTLLATFDEAGDAIVRDLASVNIRLARFIRSGLLRVFSMPSGGVSPEAHTLRIGALLEGHRARCLVMDPVSALVGAGASAFAQDSVLGLLDDARRRGVTVLLTSLLDEPAEDDAALGISTVVDTWMRLSYVAAAGERNRALSIVKSRGTGHSNQVRELILGKQGLSLVDVYTAGGAVLMGTLRREKEEQDRAEQTRAVRGDVTQHGAILDAIAEIQNRIGGLRDEVGRKQSELRLMKEDSREGAATDAANLAVRRRLRGADLSPPAAGKK